MPMSSDHDINAHKITFQTLAKFNLKDAETALRWIEEVTGHKFDPPVHSLKDQFDVRDVLKDGQALCL